MPWSTRIRKQWLRIDRRPPRGARALGRCATVIALFLLRDLLGPSVVSTSTLCARGARCVCCSGAKEHEGANRFTRPSRMRRPGGPSSAKSGAAAVRSGGTAFLRLLSRFPLLNDGAGWHRLGSAPHSPHTFPLKYVCVRPVARGWRGRRGQRTSPARGVGGRRRLPGGRHRQAVSTAPPAAAAATCRRPRRIPPLIPAGAAGQTGGPPPTLGAASRHLHPGSTKDGPAHSGKGGAAAAVAGRPGYPRLPRRCWRSNQRGKPSAAASARLPGVAARLPRAARGRPPPTVGGDAVWPAGCGTTIVLVSFASPALGGGPRRAAAAGAPLPHLGGASPAAVAAAPCGASLRTPRGWPQPPFPTALPPPRPGAHTTPVWHAAWEGGGVGGLRLPCRVAALAPHRSAHPAPHGETACTPAHRRCAPAGEL